MDCRNNRATKRGPCDDCRREHEGERSARRRANATQPERSRSITRSSGPCSEFVLDPDPICKACGERLSSQVDHILPMSEGGTEYNPLRGICTPCSGKERKRSSTTRARLTNDTPRLYASWVRGC